MVQEKCVVIVVIDLYQTFSVLISIVKEPVNRSWLIVEMNINDN